MTRTYATDSTRRLLARGVAARRAIADYGLDPALALSMVVWPPKAVLAAEERLALQHLAA